MKVVSKILTYRAPRLGTTAYEYTHYTHRVGVEKIRFRFLDVSDDIFDNQERCFSADKGVTWSRPLPMLTSRPTSEGTLRRFEDAKFVDPVNGLFLCTYLEGLFTSDNAGEGFSCYNLHYRVSEDGGKTSLVDEPIIEVGHTPEHPFDFIWRGKNAFGNAGPHSILRTPEGHLVLATSMSVLDAMGDTYNPGGGYGWFEVAVLIGHWQSDGRIHWRSTARISLSPDKSTRGICEPTIAQMPDGRILMVMRGSNGWDGDPECKLPSYKWYSVSCNGGLRWSEPEPWRYTDGTPFYSPGSLSQLLPHSNGKLYWFGNISERNCFGSLPRYPLLAGEVDPSTLMLKKDSLFPISDRPPGQGDMQFSNFYAHEDRESGEIILHMSHYMQQGKDLWGGDAYQYRIQP